MNIYRSKTFRAGNSDALRLPKEISPGPDVEVEIVHSGGVYTFRPKTALDPKALIDALRALPRPDRIQKRDRILAPKRHGL